MKWDHLWRVDLHIHGKALVWIYSALIHLYGFGLFWANNLLLEWRYVADFALSCIACRRNEEPVFQSAAKW